MTEAMPFLRKCDITFLRPPTIRRGIFVAIDRRKRHNKAKGVLSYGMEKVILPCLSVRL